MTLSEIVSQLKSCKFQCEAGPLALNVAFQELEKLALADENDNISYRALRIVGIDDFEMAVDRYLKAGWQLQGGVSTTLVKQDNGEFEYVYTQAMTRKY